jgi:DNA-binding response OmpR family regulator
LRTGTSRHQVPAHEGIKRFAHNGVEGQVSLDILVYFLLPATGLLCKVLEQKSWVELRRVSSIMSEATLSPTVEPPASGGEHPGADRSKRILLVEGDGFTRLVLLLRLRLAGFKVDFTSNGYLGLGKLRTCRPDILLIELKLCGLSGLELIKAARAEPGFGDRPIYVFTQVERMNRTARKELLLLATKIFDKSSMSREELVQTFATMFFKRERIQQVAPSDTAPQPPVQAPSEVISSQEIEEIVAGVREQSELLVKDNGGREASGKELLSRVSSLKSCAEAARLSNLARQAKGLENFLKLLNKRKQAYSEGALRTVSRAVQMMSRMAFKATGQEQSVSSFKAVLVDEAPRSNQAVEKALREVGFTTLGFEDARLALEHLTSKKADLIVANLILPEAHGMSLADIRRLPLHSETPVLFAPDATLAANADDELPTSAPRLDAEPLLLAELVVKALNEMQSPHTSGTGPEESPTSPVVQVPVKSSTGLDSDDDFELFAKAPSNPSLIDASIPAEPFLRAEPGTPGPDREAEFLIQLPETAAIDGVQNEERALEALPPSALFAQMMETPQPETTGEDQAASTPWLAAATDDTGETVSVNQSASASQQNEAAAADELSAAVPNDGENMNNQLDATSTEYAQQVEGLRRQQHPREDLAARVCAAEMALYHAKAEAERKGKTIEALQAQLTETLARGEQADAEATPEQTEAEQKALARCAELEQEVASLRQAFEGFGGGVQPEASENSETHIQELEERLNQNAAELEKHKAEQQEAETELRHQLEDAKNAHQPLEAARQQAETRCAQLEQELAAVRQAQLEKAGKADQKPGAENAGEAGVPESELEQQVRQGVMALAKATAELAKERGERQRSQQRAAELNSRLQALHDDLRRTLQSQREDLARITAVEEENRQLSQTLEQRTADVEQHKAEHLLTEEQFQKAKEANTQLRKDLAFFEEASKKFGGGRQELQARLESTLNAARENDARLQRETTERQKLAENLENTQRELQNQQRRRESLEQELKATQEALRDREVKLQKEVTERQRLNEALRTVQGNPHDGSERYLELTKLQSSLEEEQVERKRQETQLARIRQKAVDAAHAARALRTNLRRQIRGPIDNLVHSSRMLLELELSEEQKQVAESVLQDVLLVQTRLREPDLSSGESSEPTAPNTAA